MAMGKVAWKIMGTGGAILAGVIATKIIDAIWARAGQDEINPKNPHAPLAKAVVYAAITDLAVLEAPSYEHLAYRPGMPLARALDLG